MSDIQVVQRKQTGRVECSQSKVNTFWLVIYRNTRRMGYFEHGNRYELDCLLQHWKEGKTVAQLLDIALELGVAI